MNIGQLAHLAGVPVDTVRYYERQGLLPVTRRSGAGYRIFDEKALKRLRFIRRAKALGFTLEEIASLLALSDQRGGDMAGVRDAASARLADIEHRIKELQRMHIALTQLVQACPGHGDLAACPIITALQESAS